jgi:hypothetical protein
VCNIILFSKPSKTPSVTSQNIYMTVNEKEDVAKDNGDHMWWQDIC